MRFVHSWLGRVLYKFHMFKKVVEWEKSYFKLNTCLFEGEEYEAIVDEAIDEVGRLTNRNIKEKRKIFMISMKKYQFATTQEKLNEEKTQNGLNQTNLKGRLKEIQEKVNRREAPGTI